MRLTTAGTRAASRMHATFVLGVLVTGSLDLLEAMLFHALHGVAPMQILQSIAGGFLGRATFHGGVSTAMLGTVTHYAIIATMLAVYVFARTRNRWLQRHLVAGGLLYGCMLFVVMTFVVLPLSAAVEFLRPLTAAQVANGVFAHAALVGLPIAWFARRIEDRGRPDEFAHR